MKNDLIISSGKQQLICIMYSISIVPGSACISCTFFNAPDVANNRLALASCGNI